ncbi:hypothetical glycine-rich protein [Clavibacter sepedonicus]|uniref:Hypothetical glycine-rich protein n=1 Tax=Clavibacter sepedonicus TaxID=31964 RepID=B0RFE2_CLASE|nr:hypothetical glycine-rich protein [Clavibacter sepedonicus]
MGAGVVAGAPPDVEPSGEPGFVAGAAGPAGGVGAVPSAFVGGVGGVGGVAGVPSAFVGGAGGVDPSGRVTGAGGVVPSGSAGGAGQVAVVPLPDPAWPLVSPPFPSAYAAEENSATRPSDAPAMPTAMPARRFRGAGVGVPGVRAPGPFSKTVMVSSMVVLPCPPRRGCAGGRGSRLGSGSEVLLKFRGPS